MRGNRTTQISIAILISGRLVGSRVAAGLSLSSQIFLQWTPSRSQSDPKAERGDLSNFVVQQEVEIRGIARSFGEGQSGAKSELKATILLDEGAADRLPLPLQAIARFP
jgi:hypothetical protein